MNVYRVKTGSILPLGKQGENLARKIQFDISRWISTFGPGTVQLLHQRSGDEAPYPVAVYREGNFAVWTVTDADTAAPGTGHAELQYYVGDALAKSETWMTKVFPALGPAGETPPEAQQGWVDQVLAQVARITGMTAQAVELPAGSAPTADYADGVLTIGIPLGGDVSEAQIAQAVAEYLEKHPIAETDPTVPAWAKAETKPSYTATEVGADPSGTAAGQVSAHNAETTAHNDIRLLIQGLAERLNTLVDSDDTTLDQLSEIVAYIKGNRTLIETITTSKVSVADIIDNLTTNVTNKPLSAAQGVALKALIDAISIPDKLPNPNSLTFTGAVSGSYDGSAPLELEIPSGGGGGSGSGEKWVKIADYTWTEEDAAETNPPLLIYSTDADGNALAIDALYISCDAKTSANRTLYGTLSVGGSINYTIKAENMFVNGQKLIVYNELKKLPKPHAIGYAANGLVTANGGAVAKYYIKHFDNELFFKYPATGVSIFPSAQILAGSTFSIWGRVANV